MRLRHHPPPCDHFQVALKFHGCSVIAGVSGQEALQRAASDHPDLIVLDVMLPAARVPHAQPGLPMIHTQRGVGYRLRPP